MNKTFTKTLAALLMVTFLVPAAFLAAPQRASAQAAAASGLGCIAGLAKGLAGAAVDLIKDVPSASGTTDISTWFGASATVDGCLYQMIIVPALKAMIRGFLQSMTTSTINWINGNNSTGQPSYVPNLGVHLQGVGDSAGLSLIAKIANGFGSPFGIAISSALRTNYQQQTSLAGFFAANRNTLPGTLQSQQAFLGGNWSQGGGIASWFALTTQPQNNPYTLYQAAQGQIVSNVTQAQTNRRQDLIQSQGFLSYCGGDTHPSVSGVTCTGKQIYDSDTGTCVDSVLGNTSASVKPQAPCTNPDGSPANATTPGSTISSYLQANVNSGIGQFVNAQDLDSALGQVVSALANKVLSSTGLFGSSQPSSSQSVSTVGVSQSNAAANSQAHATEVLQNLAVYIPALQTIESAEQSASSSLVAFIAAEPAFEVQATNFKTTICSTQQDAVQATIDKAQATRAQASAMLTPTGTLGLLLGSLSTSLDVASTTRALALKVQVEAAANNLLPNDTMALTTALPTPIDMLTIEDSAGVNNGASATLAGSLSVSGGTTVDQMNLIRTNAAALISSFQTALQATQTACDSLLLVTGG